MSDRDSTLMQRREFVQTSAAATAAAVTVASLGPAQVQAQTRGRPAEEAFGQRADPAQEDVRQDRRGGDHPQYRHPESGGVHGPAAPPVFQPGRPFLRHRQGVWHRAGVQEMVRGNARGAQADLPGHQGTGPEQSATSSRTSTSGSRRSAPTTSTCSTTTDWAGARSTGPGARR